MLRVRILFMLVLFACSGNEAPDLSRLADMRLQLADGSMVPWSQVRGGGATVFITLDPECPFCQGYAPLIDSLARHYSSENVRFCGLYPARFMNADSVSRFAGENKFSFRQVLDHDCTIANMLHARVTPECFVLDSTGALGYVGAIDAWAVRAGRHKTAATEHYLSDAISALTHGDTVGKGAPAVGCIVECEGDPPHQ